MERAHRGHRGREVSRRGIPGVLLAVFLFGCGDDPFTPEPVEAMALVGTEPPPGSVARIGLPFAGSITVSYRFDEGASLVAICGYCHMNPSGFRECGLQPLGRYTTDGGSVTGSGVATFRPTCSAIPDNALAVQLSVLSFPPRQRGESGNGPVVRVEFQASSAP